MESVLTNISTLTPASKILQESMFPSSLTKLSLSAKWRPRQESQFISSHWCRPSNDCKVHDCHRRSCSSPFISGRHIWRINDQENAPGLFGQIKYQISTDTHQTNAVVATMSRFLGYYLQKHNNSNLSVQRRAHKIGQIKDSAKRLLNVNISVASGH